MGKIDYSCPLPETKLIKRYKPAFDILVKNKSATILSIPHLGHTSHLRSISSDISILKKLGINNQVFIFIDRDKVNSNYESFASELLTSIDDCNLDSNAVQSQNAYILNKTIIHQTKEITKVKPIIISVVIENNINNYLSEIENLFLIIQKSASKYPVSILWISSTKTAREYRRIHPSSTILTNITYQKNFDEIETCYCLKRISHLKGQQVSDDTLKNCLELTGGFACTFHQFINTGNILESDYVKSSLLDIQSEVKLDDRLVTSEGLKFLNNLEIDEVEFESIKLKSNPTSQEINLVRFLQKNIDKPVSRDEIAEAIWGKSWNAKYSDWAIDKAISRFRKNIISENYKIITVKNFGYELVKL